MKLLKSMQIKEQKQEQACQGNQEQIPKFQELYMEIKKTQFLYL